MRRVLVAFTSREGQTHHIAHHTARQFENRGLLVRLIDIDEGETEAGADDCDGAVLASSLHRGQYGPALAGFIMRHGPALNSIPSAFLSISLTAASDDPKERRALNEISRAFLAQVGWTPDVIEQVAGALHDRELNFLERQVLHAIVDSKGVTRDPSGHTVFTDWAALDNFTARFGARIPKPDPSGKS